SIRSRDPVTGGEEQASDPAHPGTANTNEVERSELGGQRLR
ncbi:MAG: hypothetical protein QOH44_950, partial [Actinomycetota bacterium]|nr:hypothetical protein [Actinomycetota bacterium]